MAEHDTLEAIRRCIDARESFVVEAGAGSGKTRALIQSVQSILDSHRIELLRSNRQVVCITYTNVAKDEIIARLNDDPLVLVGTIHEFLWQVIAGFQKELRLEVLEINRTSKKPVDDLDEVLQSVSISYGKYGRHFDRGELFHDDVITIAGALFEKYPKMVRIAADQFPYIFVDEYQDTSQTVVDLLLKHFVESDRKPVVGFFGDSMQQIYGSKVSDVAAQNGLALITKTENYRCSVAVISVLNRLRTDLEQKPTGSNRPGDVHVMTASSSADSAYRVAMSRLVENGWTLENTKILMLTHKGIAREIGFADLLAAYALRSFGNDALMERSDELGEFFTYVSELSRSYSDKKYGDFLELLGKSGLTIKTQTDKRRIATEIEALLSAQANGSVRDVVDVITESALIPTPPRLARLLSQLALETNSDSESFAKRRPSYAAVLEVPWAQVEKFVDYADAHTPFSTKHGVKGAEFENVLVIVDDSLWNQYKFAQVFSNDSSNAVRLERSRKLLYVCFSRSRSGLAMLCLGSFSNDELAGAKALLGVQTIEDLSS